MLTMAKTKSDAPAKEEGNKKEVKAASFKLLRPYAGKAIEDSVKVGPKGEQYLRTNKYIK